MPDEPPERIDIDEVRALRLAVRRDPLTGTANRIALEDRLEKAMAAFEEDATPFAVLFFDVDFFKGINDRFGHSVGDDVLVALADRLRQQCGDADLIARFGGDEFLVVSSEADAASAARRGERIRNAIAQPPLRATNNLRVTISCGVAVVETGDSIDTLLRRADQALYRAKQSGRNRTRVLTSTDLTQPSTFTRVDIDTGDPLLVQARMTASLTPTMLLTTLGRLLRDHDAQVTGIDHDCVTLRFGRSRWFDVWNRRNRHCPVEATIEFGTLMSEDESIRPTSFVATIRPLGRRPHVDGFQTRARGIVELLASEFPMTPE